MKFENEEQITKQYLDDGNKVFKVDTNEYMDNGAGRFALGSQFEFIQKFFGSELDNVEAKEYSKAEMAALLGYDPEKDFYGYKFQQYNFRDNKDDYFERTYVNNTTAFKISDQTTFVVNQDGSKYIKNYGIEPYVGSEPENFNFDGGNILTNTLNLYLESKIDPNGVGSTVNIEFTGDRAVRDVYTLSDYQDDIGKSSTWKDAYFIGLRNDLNTFVNQLKR
jgi:hypothetical protein